jgi:hypothetical protein
MMVKGETLALILCYRGGQQNGKVQKDIERTKKARKRKDS